MSSALDFGLLICWPIFLATPYVGSMLDTYLHIAIPFFRSNNDVNLLLVVIITDEENKLRNGSEIHGSKGRRNVANLRRSGKNEVSVSTVHCTPFKNTLHVHNYNPILM